MNDLEILNFNGNEVRVVMVNNEPWWVLRDVCDVLGLSNTPMTASRLDKDDISLTDIVDLAGRKQEASIVSEPGLYTLILRCRDAMTPGTDSYKFRKWVTSEVLPRIRKTGGYLSPEVDFTNPDTIRKVFESWAEDRKKLIEAEARNTRLVHNNRTFTAGEIAKELGFRSAQEFNEELRSRGIHSKDSRGVWLLKSEYADKGFNNIKQRELPNGTISYYAEWTGLGRDWILGVLSQDRHQRTDKYYLRKGLLNNN